ncbi:MAG: alpha-ribazole phosphatase, partial [Acidimicrobiaceae bacterium]|nr:alpha-ribazole phosphatase [Acidimicrobiaceae bacterium]
MILRLVRHGETDWSAERRYTGRSNVGLNSVGRRQAAALAVIAAGPYDSVWCSDLGRCVETATLMEAEATPTPELREFDFGEIEGRRWPDLDEATQRGLLDFDGFVAPGGES